MLPCCVSLLMGVVMMMIIRRFLQVTHSPLFLFLKDFLSPSDWSVVCV